MTRRVDTARAVVARPVSWLVSAALLVLSVVSGVSGMSASAGTAPGSTVAAASTTSSRVTADRRSTPVLSTLGSRQQVFGSAPHHPELADAAVTEWHAPSGLVDALIPAESVQFVLSVQVSHRGRAPPTGSLLT